MQRRHAEASFLVVDCALVFGLLLLVLLKLLVCPSLELSVC